MFCPVIFPPFARNYKEIEFKGTTRCESETDFPVYLPWVYLYTGCSECCGSPPEMGMPALPRATSQHLMKQEFPAGRDSLKPCVLGRKPFLIDIKDSSLVLCIVKTQPRDLGPDSRLVWIASDVRQWRKRVPELRCSRSPVLPRPRRQRLMLHSPGSMDRRNCCHGPG